MFAYKKQAVFLLSNIVLKSAGPRASYTMLNSWNVLQECAYIPRVAKILRVSIWLLRICVMCIEIIEYCKVKLMVCKRSDLLNFVKMIVEVCWNYLLVASTLYCFLGVKPSTLKFMRITISSIVINYTSITNKQKNKMYKMYKNVQNT